MKSKGLVLGQNQSNGTLESVCWRIFMENKCQWAMRIAPYATSSLKTSTYILLLKLFSPL